jgi:hypothetical protein
MDYDQTAMGLPPVTSAVFVKDESEMSLLPLRGQSVSGVYKYKIVILLINYHVIGTKLITSDLANMISFTCFSFE